MLLNTLQYTGQPPAKYLAQKVNSAKVEKACSQYVPKYIPPGIECSLSPSPNPISILEIQCSCMQYFWLDKSPFSWRSGSQPQVS